MNIEYLEGHDERTGEISDVWVLFNNDGKIVAFVMYIFTNC